MNINILKKDVENEDVPPLIEENLSLLPQQTFSFDIDAIGVFTNYLPHNNIETIIKKSLSKRSMRRKSKSMGKKTISPLKKEENSSQ